MRIVTYLNFNGQCEAAFKFYAATFNGKDKFGIPWMINCSPSNA